MGNDSIVGTCLFMCPSAEMKEYAAARELAGLVHALEKSDNQPTESFSGPRCGGGRDQFHSSTRKFKQLVKADKDKAVKAYSRPAAGVNKTNPSDLRPPHILKQTVAYLCLRVLTRTDLPFIDVYDFVFDRLRAVRQDMVIQRICDESAILILEAIVKFHLYAEHRFMRNVPINYDGMINQKHLGDCLKTLLSIYGINNFNGPTRCFFEALYCLNSPESYEVISRAFKIRTEMKDSPVFLDALQLCLAIQSKNYFKFFQLLDELPPLLTGYVVQRVPLMRMHALRTFAVSYGVKSCKIPLAWIKDILCYPSQAVLWKDLSKIGCQIIELEEENGAKFVKFEKSISTLKTDNEIPITIEVKFGILNGLSNLDVLAAEQICQWGHNL